MPTDSSSPPEEKPSTSGRISWQVYSALPKEPEFINQWSELAGCQVLPSIFTTYEWIAAWWCHFGEGRQLRLICGSRDGRLAALAPLMITTRPLYLTRAARIMEFIGTAAVPTRGMGLADRIDFLYLPGETDILEALTRKVIEDCADCDLLMLRALPASSPTVPCLVEGAEDLNLSWSRSFRSLSPFTQTEGSWEDFLAGRKSKTRRQWRNSQRRLTSLGEFEFSCFPENGWPFEKAFDSLLFVNRLSHKWAKKSSLFQTAVVRDFYRDVSERIHRCGRLQIHFLMKGEQVVAYQFGFCYGKRFFGYNTAYQHAFSAVHPGIHLLVHVLQKAFNSNMQEYDMMRGEENHKRHWSSHQREEIHLVCFRRSPVPLVSFLLLVKLKECFKKSMLIRTLYDKINGIARGD